MKRREWLAALGLLGTAGCVGGPPRGKEGSPSANEDRDSPGTTEAPDAATPGTDGFPRYHIADASVERFDLGLRLNDAGTTPVDEVVAAGGLDERERRVVAAAVEAGYETDDVEPWLLEFLDETRYVELDGTIHRLDPTVPEYVLTASETTESAVEGSIASADAYREAVTYGGARRTGLLRIAKQGPVRWLTMDPDLRDFLERYDAVHYRGDVVAVEFGREDPGPPYAVRAEATSREDVAGGPILEAGSLPEALARPLREAARVDGVHGVSDPPEGLESRVEEARYVEVDGQFYHAYADSVGDLPLTAAVEVVDADARAGDPALLRLSVTNEGDAPIEIANGPPLPFGVPRAETVGGASVLLWLDAYEESEHVFTDGRSVTGRNSIAKVASLAAGETSGRTYELDADGLRSATYHVRTTVGAGALGEGGSMRDVPLHFQFDVVEEVA